MGDWHLRGPRGTSAPVSETVGRFDTTYTHGGEQARPGINRLDYPELVSGWTAIVR